MPEAFDIKDHFSDCECDVDGPVYSRSKHRHVRLTRENFKFGANTVCSAVQTNSHFPGKRYSSLRFPLFEACLGILVPILKRCQFIAFVLPGR